MELIQIKEEIEKKVRELEIGRKVVKDRALEKANAIARYDSSMAIQIIRLRNQDAEGSIDFEGLQIKGSIPVTLIDKIAKGLCFKEKLNVETAEGLYKAAISGMESLRAELNGLQSINKHFD